MQSSSLPISRNVWRILLLVAVSVALLSPTSALSSTGSAIARVVDPGVCAGVTGCHVKARADVNGDGSADVIGIARRGESGAPSGAVIVRVQVGPQRIASFRARTEFWSGPVWQGVARLGGGSGKEIMVGHTMGAHAQFYLALTWRHGQLVPFDAPGRGRTWYIDGAVWISAGWLRLPNDPAGKIYRRVAIRVGDATQSRFKGKVTTFRWAHGRWNRHGTRTIFPLPDKRAFSWGGFRVPGLNRW